MRQSPGKDAARRFLYEECLPSLIPDAVIRSHRVVLLAGADPRELPLLDRLHIPRAHITSCENDPAILQAQRMQNLGINLQSGDVSLYLRHILLGSTTIGILILDIEGTILAQLDDALTPVVLHCWKNPKTFLAMSASVGRDHATICEGFYSAHVLSALAPGAFARAIEARIAEYRLAGFGTPLHLVVRELLWLRTLLEHILAAGVAVGSIDSSTIRALDDALRAAWKSSHAAKPRTLAALLAHASSDPLAEIRERPLGIGVRPEAFARMSYRGANSWSQLFHVALLERSAEPASLRTWVEHALALLGHAGLTHFDAHGRRVPCIPGQVPDLCDIVIAPKYALHAFSPRPFPTLMGTALQPGVRATISALRSTGILRTLTRASNERR